MRRNASGNTKHLENALVAVPNRQDRQRTVSRTKLKREVFDLGAHIRVRELNPLRSPRRARCVNNREKVVRLDSPSTLQGGIESGSTPRRAVRKEIFQMPHTFRSLHAMGHENDLADVRELRTEV